MLNILFIGDIVGNSGRTVIKENLLRLKKELDIHLVIANAENAAGGLGITGTIAKDLHSSGVDVLTLGNHTWSKSEALTYIETDEYLIRPANMSNYWPGKGYCVVKTPVGNVIVINLLGRVSMTPANCPFEVADEMILGLKARFNTKMTVIDFHAEATSEKQAFARYFDGRVSLVAGTHTHVQTADETIFERGTGYITDVGMTGPVESIIGMNIEGSIKRFVQKLPVPYLVANGPGILSAIFAKIDEKTGQTMEIRRFKGEKF